MAAAPKYLSVLRALVAAGTTGLTTDQLECLVPDCTEAVMLLARDGAVTKSIQSSSLLVVTAYGRAWLAVRGSR